MARHEILNYLYQQEPDCIMVTTRFIEIQQSFTDWCYDLAEELEIEDEVDVGNAIEELERAGILSLNMELDYVFCVEFRPPLDVNQLMIPFERFGFQGDSV